MKNPKRQLGQYRHMIEQQARVMRWIWLAWAVPMVFVATAFFWDWYVLIKGFSIIAVATGAISHFNASCRLQNYQRDATQATERTQS